MGNLKRKAREISEKALAAKMLQNRPQGLLGFTGAFALGQLGSTMVDVIVTFTSLPGGVAKAVADVEGKKLARDAAETAAEAERTAFQRDIAEIAGDYKILAVYKNALNGAAVSVPANKVPKLLELSYVHAIYPNTKLSSWLPDNNKSLLENQKAAPFSEETPDLKWIGMREGRETLHVNELHERGIIGEGVQVGVIDTGIDYNHPDLQDAYVGGRNYEDDQSADDPFDTFMHGTHVSGTIVGRGVNATASALGMAPGATVFAYRVGRDHSIDSSAVLEALEVVAEDGCDVVNMSLFDFNGYPTNPQNLAVTSVALEHDIVFAIAASNIGENYLTKQPIAQSVSAPSNTLLAITVANATVPQKDGVQTVQAAGGEAYQVLRLSKDWTSGIQKNADGTILFTNPDLQVHEGNTYKFVPTKTDKNGLPSGIGTPNEYTAKVIEAVKGNIAVVLLDAEEYEYYEDDDDEDIYGFSVGQAVETAKQYGAGGILVIDAENAPYQSGYDTYNYNHGESINYVLGWIASKAQGMAFIQEALANDGFASFVDSTTRPGGNLHLTSARGANPQTYEIKPDIAAHGASVLSTIPPAWIGITDGNYEYAYKRETGTSMSSPHIAGLAALLRGYSKANGLGWSAQEIKARLMNTATPTFGLGVFDTGAGYADAQRALDADLTITVVYENNVALEDGTASANVAALNYGAVNLAKPFSKTLQLEIHNTSNQSKTMRLSHQFNQQSQAAIIGYDPRAALNYPEEIIVASGETVTVPVTLELPANPEKTGSFEGYLTVMDGSVPYRVPYGAVTGMGFVQGGFFQKMWMDRPVLASSGAGHLNAGQNRSDVSDLNYQWAGSSEYYYRNISAPSLENSEMESVGSIGSTISISSGKAPGVYRESAYVTSQKAPAPGLYYMNFSILGSLFFAGSTWRNIRYAFVVDDTAPEVTIDQVQDDKISYTGDSVRLTGNIYDEGMALAEEAGICYQTLGYKTASQQLNGLILELGGEYRRVDLDKDGNFDVTLTGLSGELAMTVYAYDSYTPAVLESGTAYAIGFDPDLPSYYDAASNTAYYGANKVVLNYRLIQEN